MDTEIKVKERLLLLLLLLPTNQLLPSWISLRRILTKMLSLAASSGSSLPSAADQLAEKQEVKTRSRLVLSELDQIRRILLVSSQHFGKDLALQGVDVHGIFLQHEKQKDMTSQNPKVQIS